MYNIWGFGLQTIAVSIVAGIILLLKKIFEDKLSPKWQYGIWTLLAIRILIPVNVSSYVVPLICCSKSNYAISNDAWSLWIYDRYRWNCIGIYDDGTGQETGSK